MMPGVRQFRIVNPTAHRLSDCWQAGGDDSIPPTRSHGDSEP